jgi:hypothetical protein
MENNIAAGMFLAFSKERDYTMSAGGTTTPQKRKELLL